MTHKNESILATTIGISVALLGLVTYTYVIPEIMSHRYSSRVHGVAAELSVEYKKLYESTELSLLSDPSTSIEAKINDAVAIGELIKESRASIAKLDKSSRNIVSLPYSIETSGYKKALVLQDRVRLFVQQSTVALNDYEKIITSVLVYNLSVSNTKSYIDDLNKVTDFNLYAGRSGEVRAIAQAINGQADKFNQQELAQELVPARATSIETFRRAANGFESLAYGLDIAVDDLIYAAVREIEASGRQLESTENVDYVKAVKVSRPIKSVQELDEKLDFILQ